MTTDNITIGIDEAGTKGDTISITTTSIGNNSLAIGTNSYCGYVDINTQGSTLKFIDDAEDICTDEEWNGFVEEFSLEEQKQPDYYTLTTSDSTIAMGSFPYDINVKASNGTVYF